MDNKNIVTSALFLVSLFYSYLLFAQDAEYTNSTKKKSDFQAALDRQNKANGQNHKFTRFYLASYNNYPEFDNSISVFSIFFNLEEALNLPFDEIIRKSLLSTNYRTQNIYFDHKFNLLQGNTIDTGTLQGKIKNTEYDRWWGTNTENVIYHEEFTEIPALLPPFRNIINRGSGLYLGYKF